MVIAGMESVMDSNYDEMFGWQDDSVFEKCIGCRCTKLLSEEMFIYILFIFLSCSDKVDENLEAILTQVYLIWSEVVEGYTDFTARFSIECAQREGCSLRKEIEQLGKQKLLVKAAERRKKRKNVHSTYIFEDIYKGTYVLYFETEVG